MAVGALQLIGVSVEAFLPQVIFGRGKVDEIRGVADGIGDAAGGHLRIPARDIFFFHLWAGPLAVALHEDLDGVAVRGLCCIEGVAHAAGDRHMRAEFES